MAWLDNINLVDLFLLEMAKYQFLSICQGQELHKLMEVKLATIGLLIILSRRTRLTQCAMLNYKLELDMAVNMEQ